MGPIIKISGTRSYILVEFDSRAVKVAGELTTTPAFYASAGSIKRWESPFDHMEVSPEDKKMIIAQVLAHHHPGFTNIFEE